MSIRQNLISYGGVAAAQNTIALLALNGSNGSTTFTDDTGRAWVGAGNAQISTAQSKFGGSSLLLDGSGDWIQTTESLSRFRFGAGDFCVEGFFRTNASDRALVDYYSSTLVNTWQLYIDASGRPEWYSSNGTQPVLVATSTISINNLSWRHVAVTRAGSTLRIFVDGTEAALATDTRNYNASGVTTLSVGAQVFSRNQAYDYIGNIGPVRISSVPRYTSNFTPPNSPFILD